MTFFLVHFNTRSLPKNVDKLEEFLNEMTRLPNIIAISETKLNCYTYSNISNPNYNFFQSDSPTLAGGVGIYLKAEVGTSAPESAPPLQAEHQFRSGMQRAEHAKKNGAK